jgi:hypothetical protein
MPLTRRSSILHDAARAVGAVEPRTTSSGSKSSSSAATFSPSTCCTSVVTTARPIASIGCLVVVSGGSVQVMKAESS